MKRYISSIIIFLLFLTAKAATELPDTLLIVDTPSKVLITESAGGTLITVTDTLTGAEESHFVSYAPGAKVSTSRKFSKSILNLPGFDCNRGQGHKAGWSVGMDGLCIGLNKANDQTGGGGLQWSKSFEISWLSCLNVGYVFSRSRIYLGLGFDWRNFKATADERWLVPTAGGGIEWGEAPKGVNVRSTNIKIFSLQLPLMYEWRIPKSWMKLKFGPILNFNTYASLKGVYDDASGNKCEYFTKDFDRRDVTVDFFGCLSYHSAFGVYVRYSPMKMLKTGSPINFTPFTVGVSFFL